MARKVNLYAFVNPFVRVPFIGACTIWIILQICKVIFFELSGRSYLGETLQTVTTAPLWGVAVLSAEFLVPFLFLFFANKIFVINSQNLSIQINEGMRQVKETQSISVIGFTRLAEARDPDSGDHIIRVANYSKVLAERLSQKGKYTKYVTPRYIEEIFISAPLHDIGKVGIKDEILLKEGKLTDQEFEIMKMHTIIGGNIIAELERKLNFRSFFTLGKEIAYHHHQKYNGKGYPNIFKGGIMLVEEGVGSPLQGDAIPLSARIVALADVYDALVSKRCYKKAFSHETACEIIAAERSEHFDPVVVDAFLTLNDEFISIRRKFNK
ncbi:MAG: hypothetical protein A2268_11590 [Candidatus Raymondbacteria bacterium RifOxyA12_full_50_37]|nr:MAG: hypothetical protein A2268_11590 [Candidatus Raymondbacteria bacterium RifOxyA12_full_50_37]OGJ85980.1 MAG: hypothetical protein A2248_00425 [Candidatus Raymondbacteria bacterium RIFOXYA2_FULL_49_16]OGJ90086.1 MAG: hypothetical protein A2350_07965 [Candidatus Raymondbacteria bacterium RifOxyB12_full_50_8]OGJ97138.1 MAG: hypothetical protein A2453_12495 [Candidatus Raymondbacteria bacterium RIFOXYC2_FULL_50_21]OGP40187.1 MAG: hypothetical protein A2324_14595 [Candidatus Raymondbacteria b